QPTASGRPGTTSPPSSRWPVRATVPERRLSSRLRLDFAEAGRLQLEHGGVTAVRREQLVVRPLLDDTTILQHHDAIGATDRREAVRDDDGGQSAGELEEPVVEIGLGPQVEVGRR